MAKAKTKLEMARELEIERVLDRVRMAAFGMTSTDDLETVATELFAAFDTLGFDLFRCGISFVDEASDQLSALAVFEDRISRIACLWSEYKLCADSSTQIEAIRNGNAWILEGEAATTYYAALTRLTGIPEERIDDILDTVPDPMVTYYVRLSRNLDNISLVLERKLSDEELSVARRFAKVFDFAYTRYLELKRLEEQNRELQVEAALEHIRARALGMRSSDDIGEVTTQLHEQFENLGISTRRVGIWILDADPGNGEVWVTDPAGELLKCEPFTLSVLMEHEYTAGWYDGLKQGDRLLRDYKPREQIPGIVEHVTHRLNVTIEYGQEDAEEIARSAYPDGMHTSVLFFSQGLLWLPRPNPLTEEEESIACRFADVFGFAFDRYLELKRLEAQNRELQVGAALERVRSRALGMQGSGELDEVTFTLLSALTDLAFPIRNATIVVIDDSSQTARISVQRVGRGLIVGETMPLKEFLRQEEWGRREREIGASLTIEREGEPLRIYVQWWVDLAARGTPDYAYDGLDQDRRVEQVLFNSYGALILHAPSALEDSYLEEIERFSDVFGFAYSRMQELEQAEEQARQSERRAAVDHIRAEITAMATTDDFELVTPLLWQTLKVLGVTFIRCGFMIMNRETKEISMNLSDHAGNPMAVLNVPTDILPYLRTAWDRWMSGETYIQKFTRDEFVELQLAIQPGLQSLEGDRYVDPESLPDHLVSHMVPFSHGTLYVNSETPLSREDLAFVGDLAGAFSVAYARYQDFRQLEKQNEDLEEASRVKSQFLANMSHELRTPMNAIIGFTQLVLRRGSENLSERHRDNLEKVKQSADHLLTLINDVLDLSKIEANKMDIKAERFVVKDLISSSCGTVSPLVKDGVELSYEVSDEIGEAYQDSGRMRQVLINLLSNALKFTESGTVTVKAGVGSREWGVGSLDTSRTVSGPTRDDGDMMEVSVSDTGTGIPESDLEMIFEEFQQVDGSATRKHQGTGLGLSICKMLTELMGGRIGVSSVVGEGSVFTVRIPIEYDAEGQGSRGQRGEPEGD